MTSLKSGAEPDYQDGGMETILSWEEDGHLYEIDHLGIGYDSQWGEFQVYRDGESYVGFAIEESALKPEFRPAELPVTNAELIEMAKRAVAES